MSEKDTDTLQAVCTTLQQFLRQLQANPERCGFDMVLCTPAGRRLLVLMDDYGWASKQEMLRLPDQTEFEKYIDARLEHVRMKEDAHYADVKRLNAWKRQLDTQCKALAKQVRDLPKMRLKGDIG